MLQADKEQAVPEVTVLPWSSGPEDPNLRRGNEEERGGGVPILRAPCVVGEGERVQRGSRGSEDRVQQVHGEVGWERRVPPAREGAPLPRPPHQQDAIVRRCRQAPDRYEGSVWETAGDLCEG